MGVRQRGDSWQADFRHDGKRYRRDFDTKQQAEIWESETKARLLRGEPAEPPTQHDFACPTLESVFKSTRTAYWTGIRSEQSAVKNADDCIDALGRETPVNKVTTADIEDMVEGWKEKGLTGATINRKLAALSKMLHYAKDERRWISDLPFIRRQSELEHRIRWVTDKEEPAMLEWLQKTGLKSMEDFVVLLMDTGLRRGEALNLLFRDTEDGWVRVWGHDEATGNRSKAGNSRSVPMTDRVKEIVARRLSEANGEVRVFHDMTASRARDWWEKIREALKLTDDPQFVIHCLRHTFCSRLVQRSVEILKVKELAGHKAITTTLRYAHLSQENLREAIKVLDQPKLKVG